MPCYGVGGLEQRELSVEKYCEKFAHVLDFIGPSINGKHVDIHAYGLNGKKCILSGCFDRPNVDIHYHD